MALIKNVDKMYVEEIAAFLNSKARVIKKERGGISSSF
jgi:hypothetical protein